MGSCTIDLAPEARADPDRTCAAPAYLEQHGQPRTLADLAGHNCLGYTLPTPASAERWRFGKDGAVEVPVSGTVRANNGDALRVAALAGIGIIYQPTFLFSADLKAGRLLPIVLDQLFQFANAYAVYAPTRYVPAKVRRFIDFLAERWAGEPPWDAGLPAGGDRRIECRLLRPFVGLSGMTWLIWFPKRTSVRQ